MSYTAHRIDPNHPQNLGDYSVLRKYIERGELRTQMYHYNSSTGRLINRGAWSMPAISRGSRIYTGCVKAVERLERGDHG